MKNPVLSFFLTSYALSITFSTTIILTSVDMRRPVAGQTAVRARWLGARSSENSTTEIAAREGSGRVPVAQPVDHEHRHPLSGMAWTFHDVPLPCQQFLSRLCFWCEIFNGFYSEWHVFERTEYLGDHLSKTCRCIVSSFCFFYVSQPPPYYNTTPHPTQHYTTLPNTLPNTLPRTLPHMFSMRDFHQNLNGTSWNIGHPSAVLVVHQLVGSQRGGVTKILTMVGPGLPCYILSTSLTLSEDGYRLVITMLTYNSAAAYYYMR